MSRHFSIYLDILRFIAAIAVFMDHLTSSPFTQGIFPRGLGAYGAIAVVIFFVLSGYVIAYVADTREKTATQYLTARVSRLYSVIIIALFLTFTLDYFGARVNPELYGIQKVLWKPPSFEGYLATFFLVNEYSIFDFGGILAGSNAPFWSLSFEATYYLIAGLFLFSRRFVWIPLGIIVLFLAGRTIAVLFPLWLAGFFLYRTKLASIEKSKFFSPFFLLFIAVGSVVGILTVPFICKHLPSDNFGHFFPWGRGPFNRNLIQDYLSGGLFFFHILAMKFLLINSKVNIKPWIEKVIRNLGAMTFPMYLIHYPLLCFLTAISPWENNSIKHAIMLTLVCFVAVRLITPICDHFKLYLKNLCKSLNQYIDRFKQG